MRIRIVTEGALMDFRHGFENRPAPQNCFLKLSRTARPAAVFTRAS